ncbi:uncharacterized protein B0T15DRAFT_487799 [Chaetomium strumarium]|uniref:Aminoglycoside phosphotransferase domain-containing protein n=1 Tax=Chaetomium strumarium TaxID=1170767 RepID=A0AAJ0LYY0_9PEZI|nr:hypothetical protein B0T15DRAFT_487799 [Chaetomium strumarium]
MAPPLFLHGHRESGCFAVLADRKYYRRGNLFIKRTLRKHEWTELSSDTVAEPSAALPQRFRTDVAVQQYLRERTNIPLPAFASTFEDDGAMYLLPEEDRRVIEKELQQHMGTLKSLRSDTLGVPGEQLRVAPQRVCDMSWIYYTCWRPRSNVKGDFVFCHNDLGQHNVLVDPKTLKITAIIDWEFGGFWPEWFERPFWMRPDDTERCREWLTANFEAVEQQHLPTLQDKLDSMPWTPKVLDDELPSQKVAEPTKQTKDEPEVAIASPIHTT